MRAHQLAKSCGDDPDALFGVAESAQAYREARNAYVASREAQAAALAASKRATKEALVTLAGGKTAFRREQRRETTLRARALLRAQRRADEAAGIAPPPAPKAPKASSKPQPPPKGPKPRAGVSRPRPAAAAPEATRTQ